MLVRFHLYDLHLTKQGNANYHFGTASEIKADSERIKTMVVREVTELDYVHRRARMKGKGHNSAKVEQPEYMSERQKQNACKREKAASIGPTSKEITSAAGTLEGL